MRYEDEGWEINLLEHIQRRYAAAEKTFLPAYIYTQQKRHGVGASLNAGIREIREDDSLLLYLVDDWELLQPFDLTPWAKLLIEEDSIGAVRLGPPHPWLTGEIIHHPTCDWYMKLDRHHFAFAHRPALYHKRFFDAYGPFTEDVNAYECEQLYNDHFCKTGGPDIVLALPHPWKHIESVELAGVVPG